MRCYASALPLETRNEIVVRSDLGFSPSDRSIFSLRAATRGRSDQNASQRKAGYFASFVFLNISQLALSPFCGQEVFCCYRVQR